VISQTSRLPEVAPTDKLIGETVRKQRDINIGNRKREFRTTELNVVVMLEESRDTTQRGNVHEEKWTFRDIYSDMLRVTEKVFGFNP
jgi:hypothetical protein